MKHRIENLVSLIAALALFSLSLHAQEIAGTWQGTLSLKGNEKLRIVLQIDKARDGALKGTVYSIDQRPDPDPTTILSFTNDTLKFMVEALHVSYEGTLSADGKTITGTVIPGSPKPSNFVRATKETAWRIDPSSHTVQRVTVDKDVKLEVLDWGGTGRPLVLLTGLGNNAHVFDKFAPKLTPNYHVYGITRRGFGVSSAPTPDMTNYTAARLGEDVLAVIDALHLNQPVVAGHSIAGEELSYIGNVHPEKVAGLIYLDAGYPYAMYDQMNGDFLIDVIGLRQQLNQILPGATPDDDPKKVLDAFIVRLKLVEKGAIARRQRLEEMPPPPQRGSRPSPPPAGVAIMLGQQRFTSIRTAALVIFAAPHDFGQMMKDNPKARAAMEANDKRGVDDQIAAFERQVPSAHVVRIPNANHYVFNSNEADVLREMNAFIATLPATN